ncbi:hypothetical protein SM139_1068 [Stenotrophomonas maltophilia]|nr:hypothetical protein SM139_1068 [Stenotrophomonas maltophilia]
MSNDLLSIPCVLMRGGTSKGPFFLASDLPVDIAERDRLLVEVMGSGHPLQIDGIGGGNALTSKVAIIDRSSRADADVDYLFAQVRVEQQVVDTSPNCGNMLAAVGPYAIERGLVQAQDPQTKVRIHNVNTGKLIIATVETPGGHVVYRGDTRIAGAPGSAAPVRLSFLDAAGARTGKLLPSGHARETIDGVPVSLVDCAMPMMLVRAEDLGVRGDASPAELNADAAFMRRLEALRIEAAPAWASPTPATRSFPSRCCCRRRNTAAICRCVTSCRTNATPHWRSPVRSAWPPPPSRRARWPTLWSDACPFPAALPSNIRAGTCRWASVAARITHR